MVIRSIRPVEFNRHDILSASNRAPRNTYEMVEKKFVDLPDEMNKTAEEMADLISTFGRFNKMGRRIDSAETENDFVSSILEDNADEKLGLIVRNINKIYGSANFLNFLRSLFPDDSDLMLALRELLLSRRLSELQKNKIKEAIIDLEKFCDIKKINSGINIAHLAKRFSSIKDKKSLSAKELRYSYLRFLELDIPTSFIYKDWIDEFGCCNRTRILAFTMAALVSDMKASVPGIHFSEFGCLSAKLSDARILNTLDSTLIDDFTRFSFYGKLKATDENLTEDKLIDLFMSGLTEYKGFEHELLEFIRQYLSSLLIKQQAAAVQALRNIYNVTPEFLYADPRCRFFIQDFMSTLMLSMHEKEMNNIHW